MADLTIPNFPAAEATEIAGHTTESDPYIPTTYDELLYAIQTSGVYVKIAQDFDFSLSSGDGVPGSDSGWRDGLVKTASTTQCLTFKCQKLFADDKPNNDGKYKITGLNSGTAPYLFAYGGSNAVVDNISIVNCVTMTNVGYRTVTGNSPGYSPSGSSLTFNNCQLSLLVICGSNSVMPSSAAFNNCSIFMKISMSRNNYPTSHFCGWSCDQCTIQVTGLQLTFGLVQNNIINLFTNLQNSTAYLSADAHMPTSYPNARIRDSAHSCFILDISVDTPNVGQVDFYNMIGVSVVDKTLLDNSGITYTQYGNVEFLTTTEMKSENSLISVGFLP